MTKPDFDFSKHIEVPDEWIERALAIPETHSPDFRRFSISSRALYAAASVVLVLTLSLSLYFLFGNKNHEPPTAPSPTAHSVTQPTERAQEPSQDHPATQQSTQPATGAADDTTPSQAAPTAAGAPTSPTDAKPTQSPTHTAVKPTSPKPTQVTVVTPTEASWEDPSEAAAEPPDDDPNHTEAPCSESFIDVYAYVDAGTIQQASASDKVFCRLYDSEGRLLGSRNLYDISHRATMYTSDSRGMTLGYYYAMTDAEISRDSDDTFTYVFYTASGYTLASGTTRAY